MKHKNYKPGRYNEKRVFIKGQIGKGKNLKKGLFQVIEGKAVPVTIVKKKKVK